ncbi:TPA: hypothetical protein ACMDN5_001906 [Vibrio cholerae]|uniref:hypothetical protein n=1 Tax=Vibrio cholerae TaxID=666 RepID=UPI002FB4428B|nr:hypothetical protein [Vibrio cholerae]EKF9731295.1 hypothetical protein [Vibrio cholerae]
MQTIDIRDIDIDILIEKLKDTHEILDFHSIDFSGLYPEIGIKLIGDEDRLNGTLNSTICKGLSDFHNDFLKAYCIIKYGHDNLKQLKTVERQSLEFVYTVNPGCTSILVEAKEFCDSIKQVVDSVTKNMTGREKTSLFLIAILALGGYYSFDSYNDRIKAELSAEKEVSMAKNANDKEVSLAEIERDKMKSLVDALQASIADNASASKRSNQFIAQADKAYQGIVKQSLTAGAIEIQYQGATNVVLSQDEAKEIVSNNKQQLVTENGIKAVEILSIRWTDDDNLSVTARIVDSTSTFIMSVDSTYVEQTEIEILVNEGFGKKEVIYVDGSYKIRGLSVEKAVATKIFKEDPSLNATE